MVKRFYLDTSIWRDYFEDRKDGIRPLGEFAFQFLKNCRGQNCKILYSAATIFELKEFADRFYKEIVPDFKDLLILVPIFEQQKNEAATISMQRNLPFNDVLHAILARDNNAIIITRDRHFEELFDVTESRVPEQVLFD
ncbi:MAG TPA: PIN domain-containing protein [archaeon]|nr:PIN domain-containing protein [archaeon]